MAVVGAAVRLAVVPAVVLSVMTTEVTGTADVVTGTGVMSKTDRHVLFGGGHSISNRLLSV